jgi:hypothetical protein
MANTRRSLGAALAMTPDKLSFIQGATTQSQQPVAGSPKVDSQIVVPIEEEPKQGEPGKDVVEVVRPQQSRPQRRVARERQSQEFNDDAMLSMANLLVPLTTRLQPKTAAALKRAGLEQRLRGRKPSTVQEIAEIAIQDWLKDSGYLD